MNAGRDKRRYAPSPEAIWGIRLGVAAFLLLGCSCRSALAVDVGAFDGHKVEVVKSEFGRRLMVDGREVHQNYAINFKETLLIDNTLVLIGSSFAGGNACPDTPFVLSFPKKGDARLDGPLDACESVDYRREGEKLVFATGQIPGRDQNVWEWTPNKGFTELAAVPFKPDDTKGWNALREKNIGHPSNVFKIGAIYEATKSLLGDRYPYFEALMAGVGSGEFRGDDYFGQSCRPHSCNTEAGMIFLSFSTKQVFVAWKPEGGKIVIAPVPISKWPQKARNALASWASSWR